MPPTRRGPPRAPRRARTCPRRPGAPRAAIDESLRLEPAAAVIDRYATADVDLAGAAIGRGDLVRALDQRRQPRPRRVRRSRSVRARPCQRPPPTSPSRRDRTFASASTSRDSRPAPDSPRCSPGCPGYGWTRRKRSAVRGPCSANRRLVTSYGRSAQPAHRPPSPRRGLGVSDRARRGQRLARLEQRLQAREDHRPAAVELVVARPRAAGRG